MKRSDLAKKYFEEGYACSQAVALSFSDLVSLSKEEIINATLPFGGGLGRLRLTCGAVSGMAFILGLLISNGENTPENKMGTYEKTRILCEEFEKVNNSLICAELLAGAKLEVVKGGVPDARTKKYYEVRPCGDLVASAADILEKYLIEQKII
jgi:C_GCAxxG_C_C family probable redox protein